MAEEIELLRQQLAKVTTNLAERDATVAAQGVTPGRSGRPIQQASVGQPVPETARQPSPDSAGALFVVAK